MSDPSADPVLPQAVEELIAQEEVQAQHYGWDYDVRAGLRRVAKRALEQGRAQAPAPACVCTVDDGLVREWVQKARAAALLKGFDLPSLPAAPSSTGDSK